MKKLIGYIFIISTIFLLVGSVAASEDADEIVELTNENNEIDVVSTSEIETVEPVASSESEEVLTAEPGTFSDFQTKLNNANSGDTIELDRDYVFSSGDTGRISFKSGSYTVDGKGHKIDGNFQSSLMYINWPTMRVTFKNITFMNSNEKAIEINGGITSVIFNNCNFINNTGFDGGAIYSEYSIVNIFNCTFENNSAQNKGGAIYSYMGNHALYIESSNFTNNEASDGGAIYTSGTDGSFQVINNRFINNSASNKAGAIHFTKDTQNGIANIKGSVFENNGAVNDGGAVYIESSSQIELNNNNFTSNSAYEGYGGAVFSYNPNTIPINNCTFDNNFAQGGGAICGQNLNVNSCNFTNNSVEIEFFYNLMGEYQAGGAIYAYELSLNNSNFFNNSAKRGGAVVADTLTVDNSKFYDNSAYEAGGAIYSGYISGKFVKITNSVFKNNTAGLEGGAVLAIDLEVDDSEFYSNKVNSTGGAISTFI